MNNIFNTPQKSILRELTPEEENCISGAGFWSDIGAAAAAGAASGALLGAMGNGVGAMPGALAGALGGALGGSTRYFIYRMRGDNVKRDETDHPFTLPQVFLTCALS